MLNVKYRCLAVLLLPMGVAKPAWAEVDFNRDVRPLLATYCLKCHGPDEEQRQADLRLDVAGDTDFQEVLRRITSADPDERMPPPEAKQTVSLAKIDTLKRWIDAGAPYAPHWAFVKPHRSTSHASAARSGEHPVDALLAMKLAEAGIEPAGQADPYTLIRRVYLDLIGLPPTLAAADAFAADPSEAHYATVVDALLDSPQYGERWARRWLDLARYADTNGYEKDRDRQIWPYRDWVIRAINADMPFDQFTIEQLAGDMLPEATPDQWVATGFHRNTMLNEEGGIDPLEFRFHAMTDRVATTGTTWLGLTIGCAQCHTHKYDPITHHDYYGMLAYLNNADEIDYIVPKDTNSPVAGGEQQRRAAAAEELLAALPEHWPGGPSEFDAAFDRWLRREQSRVVTWEPLEPMTASASVPYLLMEEDGVIFASGDTTKHDVYQLTFAAAQKPVVAIRLETLPDERLPGGGPGLTFYEGRKGDFYLTEFKIAGATITDATESYAKNQYGKLPASAKLAADGDIQSGWSVADRVGERHVAVFVLAQPLPSDQPIAIEMHFGRHYASSLGKFRLSATSDDGAWAHDRDAEIDRLLRRPAGNLTSQEQATLKRRFAFEAPELADEIRQLADLQRPPNATHTLAMRERPADHPRPTYLHHRGEYRQATEEVTPRLPEALLPADQPTPGDRLAFARWLVSADNPLTARVVANRHWAALFGTGIVSTVDDFGRQGQPPTHPRLLDHLALFLMENQWSIKELHRHLVTSAAYRRSSRWGEPATDGVLQDDRKVQLLARFPRQRLEAEIIRDSALQAAGILNTEMFGPPVRPLQPDGVTEVAYGGPQWKASAGSDRYRRSIYTYLKRTAPFAMFTTFDAGSGESCLPRRDRSNTPLQALTLLNDPMFVDISVAFGKDLSQSGDDLSATVTHAFRRVLTRFPTTQEQARLVAFYQQHGSWPALARALLCLDEATVKE